MTDRTPTDFALEFAEYLAKGAEELIEAVNALAMADEARENGDGDDLDDKVNQARQDCTEALTGLRNDVYQFRTRRDRAKAAGRPDLMAPAPAAVLPLPVLQALRFYARGDHYHLDPDQDDGFDSVSGEPDNWLCSEREDDTTMFENGGIARRVLLGQPLNWMDGDDDEQPDPVDGEVFTSATSMPACQACGGPATRHLPEEATGFPGPYCGDCGTTPELQRIDRHTPIYSRRQLDELVDTLGKSVRAHGFQLMTGLKGELTIAPAAGPTTDAEIARAAVNAMPRVHPGVADVLIEGNSISNVTLADIAAIWRAASGRGKEGEPLKGCTSPSCSQREPSLPPSRMAPCTPSSAAAWTRWRA